MENDKTHRKHHISEILNSNIFNRSYTGVEMGTVKVRSHRMPYRNATQRNAVHSAWTLGVFNVCSSARRSNQTHWISRECSHWMRCVASRHVALRCGIWCERPFTLLTSPHRIQPVVKVRGNAGERRSWAPKNCWRAFPVPTQPN